VRLLGQRLPLDEGALEKNLAFGRAVALQCASIRVFLKKKKNCVALSENGSQTLFLFRMDDDDDDDDEQPKRNASIPVKMRNGDFLVCARATASCHSF
jgi:hypothetical protein